MSDPAKHQATYEDLFQVPDAMTAEIVFGTLVTQPRPASRKVQTSALVRCSASAGVVGQDAQRSRSGARAGAQRGARPSGHPHTSAAKVRCNVRSTARSLLCRSRVRPSAAPVASRSTGRLIAAPGGVGAPHQVTVESLGAPRRPAQATTTHRLRAFRRRRQPMKPQKLM